MTNRTRRIRRHLLLLCGVASLSSNGVAADGTLAIVLDKSPTRQTVTLDDGRTLKITSTTQVQTAQGDEVPFEEIPSAESDRGRYAVTGAERIEYEATEIDGRWVADRIILRPVTAQ
jgi:hypothetical protein